VEQGAAFADTWYRLADALRTLDPAVAASYGRDWMRRHRPLEPRDMRRARWMADLMRDHGDATAIPMLQAWVDAYRPARPDAPRDLLVAHALAARLALDERPLRPDLARTLGMRNTVVPVRPDIVITGLGRHPDEIDALVRFAGDVDLDSLPAYDGIDRLTPSLTPRQRERLRDGLMALTHVREDRSHTNYGGTSLARHHGALARLGHAPSAERLIQMAARTDGSFASVVGATEALRTGLPRAGDAAYAALIGARTAPTRNHQRRVELVDTAARVMGADDARWTVGLLDPGPAHEVAVFHLARLRPRGTCDALFPAIPGSLRRTVRPALVALTLLGDLCRPHLQQLANHPRAPREVTRHAQRVLDMLPTSP